MATAAAGIKSGAAEAMWTEIAGIAADVAVVVYECHRACYVLAEGSYFLMRIPQHSARDTFPAVNKHSKIASMNPAVIAIAAFFAHGEETYRACVKNEVQYTNIVFYCTYEPVLLLYWPRTDREKGKRCILGLL